MNRTLAEWKILIAAERKKATALAVLVAVMAVVGARQLMPSMRPSSARAADRSSASSGAPVGSADADGPVMPRGPVVRVPRPGAVQRDLFRFDPISFPSPPETAPPDPVPQKSDTPPDEEVASEVAESPAARAARVRAASDRLRLRSVMFGTSPMAVIEYPDGKRSATRLVRPGDRVMGFLVSEIGAGAVWLEMDGERVELIAER